MFKWLAKKILTEEAVIGYLKDGRRALPVDEILNEKVDYDDFVTCEKCGWKILEDNAVKGDGEVRKRGGGIVYDGRSLYVRNAEDYIHYPYYCKGKCEPEKEAEQVVDSLIGNLWKMENPPIVNYNGKKLRQRKFVPGVISNEKAVPYCLRCNRLKGEVKRCANGKKYHKWK